MSYARRHFNGGGQVLAGSFGVSILVERGCAKRQSLGVQRIDFERSVDIAPGLIPMLLDQMHFGPFHVGGDKSVVLADGK